MICPFCPGRVPFIKIDEGEQTTAGGVVYPDVDPARHMHDVNWYDSYCTCKNGHIVNIRVTKKCPVVDCSDRGVANITARLISIEEVDCAGRESH